MPAWQETRKETFSGYRGEVKGWNTSSDTLHLNTTLPRDSRDLCTQALLQLSTFNYQPP